LFKEINNYLRTRFNNEFSNDENRKLRDWVSIEESKIHELWSLSIKKMENIFK
jgi:hypothetical protein